MARLINEGCQEYNLAEDVFNNLKGLVMFRDEWT